MPMLPEICLADIGLQPGAIVFVDAARIERIAEVDCAAKKPYGRKGIAGKNNAIGVVRDNGQISAIYVYVR